MTDFPHEALRAASPTSRFLTWPINAKAAGLRAEINDFAR